MRSISSIFGLFISSVLRPIMISACVCSERYSSPGLRYERSSRGSSEEGKAFLRTALGASTPASSGAIRSSLINLGKRLAGNDAGLLTGCHRSFSAAAGTMTGAANRARRTVDHTLFLRPRNVCHRRKAILHARQGTCFTGHRPAPTADQSDQKPRKPTSTWDLPTQVRRSPPRLYE